MRSGIVSWRTESPCQRGEPVQVKYSSGPTEYEPRTRGSPYQQHRLALSIQLVRFVECIPAAKRNSLVKRMLAFYVTAATFLCVSHLHREHCDNQTENEGTGLLCAFHAQLFHPQSVVHRAGLVHVTFGTLLESYRSIMLRKSSGHPSPLPCYNPSPHAHRPNSTAATGDERAAPHPAGGSTRLDARRLRRDALRACADPRHARSGHVEGDFGAALHADSAGVGDGRGALRLSGRSCRPEARPDAKHPDLPHLFVRFRALDDGVDAGRVSLHPRTAAGRRVEDRRDPGRANLAR